MSTARALRRKPTGPQNVRPLPLPLQPHPGEAWLGYTRRVAARHLVSWEDLMRTAYAVPDSLPPRATSWRDSGTCATDDTYEQFATFFRLTPSDVRGMHLQHYFGTGMSNPDVPEEFDPVATRCQTVKFNGRPDIDHARQPTTAVCCPICVTERPDILLLEWRIDWVVSCAKHEVLLGTDGEVNAADPHLLEIQAALQKELGDPCADLSTFRLLDDWLAALPTGYARVKNDFTLERMRELLPRLWSIAHHGMTAVDLIACYSGHRYRKPAPELVRALIPETLNECDPAQIAGWWGLPSSIYRGDLSDLMYPMPIHAGSSVCLTILRIACGLPVAPSYLVWHAVDTLAFLEKEGRAEQFWYAMHTAARALTMSAQFSRHHDLGEPSRLQLPRPTK